MIPLSAINRSIQGEWESPMSDPYLMTSLAVPAFAWATLQIVYFWPRMPERVASHFNFRMVPDGWMGKRPFVGTYIVTLAVLGLLTTFVVPKLLPTLYLLPAVFHFAFSFNAHPDRKRLNGMIWIVLLLFVVAMVGIHVLR